MEFCGPDDGFHELEISDISNYSITNKMESAVGETVAANDNAILLNLKFFPFHP